mmetsp:Transcript_93400/g.268967  ORF Transcript_93400/g.268967 Transcript_93400/m.268967 type:complete len:105 (+) Transcript_93400:750-1064(+)
MSNFAALGMWFGAFFWEVIICMMIAACVPENDLRAGGGSASPSIATAAAEGLTGGAMLTMIATAMLPEALHGAGQLSGMLFVLGLMLSVLITAMGGINGKAEIA